MLSLKVLFLAIIAVTSAALPPQLRIQHGNIVGKVTKEGDMLKDVQNLGEFPYMVSMEYIIPSQFCGAVLITFDKVLTAAHCLVGKEFVPLQVRAGHLIRYDNHTGNAQVRAVSKFNLHPRYNSTMVVYDIAFVTLEKPFDSTAFIKPIHLPEIGQDFTNQKLTALGWGQTETLRPSPVLKRAELTVINNYECNTVYWRGIDDVRLCAIDKEEHKQGTCFGDSGGPAVIHDSKNPSNDVLVGINSYVTQKLDLCDTDMPPVFANVPYLMNWVSVQLKL